MNSKKLSQLSNTPISTIRYYEKIGLIPAPKRKTNGYRDYDDQYVQLLQAISFLNQLGFTLQEISVFLQRNKNGDIKTDKLIQQVKEKEEQIQKKLFYLKVIQKRLNMISKNPQDINSFVEIIQSLF